MGRKAKKLDSKQDMLERFLMRAMNQELAGQTKLKHYHATKANQVNCEICLKEHTRLHRHRIIPNGLYTDENVIIVCPKCHKLIHRILRQLEQIESRFMIAIIIAKTEVK